MSRVFSVVRTLEVVSRTPQVLLGHKVRLSCGDYFRRIVGGTWKIRSEGITLKDHLRQHLTRDLVVDGVQTEGVVGFIPLVVTRPQSEGSMVTQLSYHRDRFPPHHLQKLRRLRVDRASHGKVLPNHDPIPVADIEERVVFVNISAPTPQEVASQVDEKREYFLVPRGVAAVECIGRHPV